MDFTNKLIIAPMAGIADSVFRRLCRRLGADITWSEMVSAEGLVRGGEKTVELVGFTPEERPYGVQLFGADPQTMARAAALLARLQPDFIDLNFGCPVPKVVARNGGASLMRDPALAGRIAGEVVRAARPVTVTAKIRSGWDRASLNFREIGLRLVEAGVQAVCIHPRSRQQGFAGSSEWSHIADLKQALPVPVIGSGDVCGPQDVQAMFESTGCDAVMIGRGALGNPWIFQRARALLDGLPDPGEPSVCEKFTLALEHVRMMAGSWGEIRGVLKARKHLGWYTRGLSDAARLREQLFSCSSVLEIAKLFQLYLETHLCTRTA